MPRWQYYATRDEAEANRPQGAESMVVDLRSKRRPPSPFAALFRRDPAPPTDGDPQRAVNVVGAQTISSAPRGPRAYRRLP
jgi:hypothetical protein